MCELMSIGAAIVFTALAALSRKAGRPTRALGTTAFAFWGASIMWSVDCVHSLLEGEGPLDLSRDDALLGALVLACGVVLFAVLRLREGRGVRASRPA